MHDIIGSVCRLGNKILIEFLFALTFHKAIEIHKRQIPVFRIMYIR